MIVRVGVSVEWNSAREFGWLMHRECGTKKRMGVKGMWSHSLTPIKVNIIESVDPAVVVEQSPAVLPPYAPDMHHHDQETQSNVSNSNGIEANGICVRAQEERGGKKEELLKM